MQLEDPVRDVATVPDQDVTAAADRRRFFLVATAATIGTLALILGLAMRYTNGRVVYVIDDAYIHLGMAKTLIHHGTWGVTPGVYESASSAPLWTTLEAAFLAVVPGIGDVLPLLLNLVPGIWIIWMLSRELPLPPLRRSTVPSWIVAIVLPVVALFLAVMPLVGMEATLQAALALQAFVLFARIERGEQRRATVAWFLVAIAASAFLRDETLFFAVGMAIAFVVSRWSRESGWDVRALRSRFGLAIATVVAAAVPVGILATINVAYGQGPLPNSVVAKTLIGHHRGFVRAPIQIVNELVLDPMLLLLAVVAIAYLVFAMAGRRGRHWPYALAFAVAALLHVAFADVGYVERYEEYLLVVGMVLAIRIARETIPRASWQPAMVCFAIVLVLFSPSKLQYLPNAPVGSSNQYRQQVQMARFLARYYQHDAVALNDIGSVSYLHEGRIVDLVGLASHEALEARRDDRFDRTFVQHLTEKYDVQVAVLYANLYFADIPRTWLPVGTWSLGQKKVSSLGPTVTFFAPGLDAAARLSRDLHAFQPSLPRGVKVSYNPLVQVAIARHTAPGA